MINKSKKFKLLITKINDHINAVISEINSLSRKNKSLFVHTLIIKLNNEEKILKIFLNSNKKPSSEIKLDSIYYQEILKQLNEIINKIHFFNYHTRIIICEEKDNQIYLELPSQSLSIPNISEILSNFSKFFEKKLEKNNYFIKNFSLEKDEYYINFELCCIFHNFAKFGTFDLLLFKNRLYDINMSKNENIIFNLKSRMDFNLSEDNTYIYFNKLKESSINIFIFGNYIFDCKEKSQIDNEQKIIYDFIYDSINSIIEEFYEKIKLFSENKQMIFNFNIISGCLKDIYTTTNDPELYDVFNKLFEPMNNDNKFIQNKLAKNFMLCSQKKINK